MENSWGIPPFHRASGEIGERRTERIGGVGQMRKINRGSFLKRNARRASTQKVERNGGILGEKLSVWAGDTHPSEALKTAKGRGSN
jgi:hypothetical protein